MIKDDRRGKDRRVSPAVGENAIIECARLRELNKKLLKAVSNIYMRCQSIPSDTPDDLKRDLRHIEATCRAVIAYTQVTS